MKIDLSHYSTHEAWDCAETWAEKMLEENCETVVFCDDSRLEDTFVNNDLLVHYEKAREIVHGMVFVDNEEDSEKYKEDYRELFKDLLINLIYNKITIDETQPVYVV